MVLNFVSFTGRGIAVILCGLIARLIISMVAISGNGFNLKERILIGAAWLPKATVQVGFIRNLNIIVAL